MLLLTELVALLFDDVSWLLREAEADILVEDVAGNDIELELFGVVKGRLGDERLLVYSEVGLAVDVVLEPTERGVDNESAPEDRDDVLSVDVMLEVPAMDDDRADDSPIFDEEVVILDVVSRLEAMVEFNRDVEPVFNVADLKGMDDDIVPEPSETDEDEIDDAVSEDISRADEDREDGTLTVEEVEKVVPIEVDCFAVSVDVGRDKNDDDDLVFEEIVETADVVNDVISESSKVENDRSDDDSLAFEELEKVVSIAVDEVVETGFADIFLLGDVRNVEGTDDEVILRPSG